MGMTRDERKYASKRIKEEGDLAAAGLTQEVEAPEDVIKVLIEKMSKESMNHLLLASTDFPVTSLSISHDNCYSYWDKRHDRKKEQDNCVIKFSIALDKFTSVTEFPTFESLRKEYVNAEKAFFKLKADIADATTAAIDVVMLGTDSDAARALQDFREKIEALTS